MEKVRNPLSGRWIKVGGPVYNDLTSRGVRIPHDDRKKGQPFVPAPTVPPPKRMRRHPVDTSPNEPWGANKPISIKQRRTVMTECGDSCFLIPDFKKPKFPICNKNPPPCVYNCTGIKAAAARAGEWKYKDVLARAKQLSSRFGCYKK